MAGQAKLQALRDACGRDAVLRARLEATPDEVLREFGVVPDVGVTAAALVRTIVGGELGEVDLGAVAGGVVSMGWDLTFTKKLD